MLVQNPHTLSHLRKLSALDDTDKSCRQSRAFVHDGKKMLLRNKETFGFGVGDKISLNNRV
jgi:hypothetical protein